MNTFKKILDNQIFKNQNTITFDGFNFVLKRQQWVDDDEVKISLKDNKVFADLTLNFFTAPIILLLISGLLIILNINQFKFILFGIVVFWAFYLLLFVWTVTMFKITIKRTIKHKLFLVQTDIKENKMK